MSRDDNDENIYPFAILMPVTSKNNESDILQSLKKVAKNLSDNQSIKVPFRIYSIWVLILVIECWTIAECIKS